MIDVLSGAARANREFSRVYASAFSGLLQVFTKYPESGRVRSAAAVARAKWVSIVGGISAGSVGKDDFRSYSQIYKESMNKRIKEVQMKSSEWNPQLSVSSGQQSATTHVETAHVETQTLSVLEKKAEVEKESEKRCEWKTIELVVRNTVTGESYALPIDRSQFTLNGVSLSGVSNNIAVKSANVHGVDDVVDEIAKASSASVMEVEQHAIVQSDASIQKGESQIEDTEWVPMQDVQDTSSTETAVGQTVEKVENWNVGAGSTEVQVDGESAAPAEGNAVNNASAKADSLLKQLEEGEDDNDLDSDSDEVGSEGSGGDLPSLCDEPPDDF